MASGNTRPVETPEQNRQCFQRSNGGQDNSGPLSPNKRADETVNYSMNGQEEPAAHQQEDDGQLNNLMPIAPQEWQATSSQQASGGQVNGLANSVAVGGHTVDASCAVQEMDQTANSTGNINEWQQHYQLSDGGSCSASNHCTCNGKEAMDASYSIQEGVVVTGQSMERAEQPSYQQGQGALSNGLRSPTQETGQHASYGTDGQRSLVAEAAGDQNCACNYPMQETGQSADLPPCYQLSDDAHVNAVSSMGSIEQAVEHICEDSELQLWKQELDRQVLYPLHLFN